MKDNKIVDITKKLNQNKKKPKRKLGTFFFRGLIFLIIIVIFYAVSSLSRLSVVYFEGLEVVSRSALIELGEISENPWFITLNLNRIRERLEIHPLIEQASVRRKGVNSLTINVTEVQIVGCVDVEGELRYILATGETLRECHKVAVSCSDVIIRGLSELDLEGNILSLFVNSLMEVEEVIISLIQEINYEPKHGDINRFSIFMKDGNTVKVNSYTMVEKLKLYPALALQSDEIGTFHLDVGVFFEPYH